MCVPAPKPVVESFVILLFPFIVFSLNDPKERGDRPPSPSLLLGSFPAEFNLEVGLSEEFLIQFFPNLNNHVVFFLDDNEQDILKTLFVSLHDSIHHTVLEMIQIAASVDFSITN